MKKMDAFRSYFIIFILFAAALFLRNWSLLVVVMLCSFAFWKYRLQLGKTRKQLMSEEEMEARITAWEPLPLVPETCDSNIREPQTIEGKITKYVNINGKECLNMISSDFYGLIGNERIEEAAKNTIFKYGVGSCGPRNFYGTVDVHLNLEKQLADFLGCEEAILYSYGFATIASAIPAYSKKDDLIFVDKSVNFSIQKGLQASKSKIIWFNHNDMDHLERLLEEQSLADSKNKKKTATIRKFIVVEGIYANTADLCPLDKLIEFKWKYKVRIFVDESLSFGVLGENGKGITEHFGIDAVDVDLISASLENAVATTGGFCAGRSFVIGHQRLSGLGYCFSASLPPLLTVAASEAINIIQEKPNLPKILRQKSIALHKLILNATEGLKFVVIGDEISPLKHIGFEHEDKAVIEQVLNDFVSELQTVGILVSRAHYLSDQEAFSQKATVKVTCRVDVTDEEMEKIGEKFRLVMKKLNRGDD
uniref:Serine palmitoyltransferase 1 n=1 Tax=Meloidogyne enterolobii TaxID=390850 RepID=A0A6V7WCL1_MELEN|nr:unnamed protein product [Meloidogyne enterolobii]